MATNLNQCLSQLHGYTNAARVRRDAEILLSRLHTLRPQIGSLMHNDGHESTVLMLSGTVPIFYRGSQYNIPLDIYVLERYPQQPPTIYVRPTSSMMIKPGHKHVSPDGLVYMPYLSEWRETTHTLEDLCNMVSSLFSSDPPVFSKPPASAANPNPNPNPTPNPNPNPNQYPGLTVTVTPPPPARLTNTYAASLPASQAHTYTHTQTPPPAYGDAVAGRYGSQPPREALVQQLTLKLQRELNTYYSRVREEIDAEFNIQSGLRRSQDAINSDVAQMQALKERLRAALRTLTEKDTALEAWHGEMLSKAGDDDVDALVRPLDPPSRQLIDALSEYHAIEDTLYFMDRALANASSSTMNVEIFMKEMRKLSRQQFLAKCMVIKLQQACS